jgi:serine protease
VLVPGPVALNFGVSRDTLTLSLSNGTGGALTVNDLSADANWVTITPVMVDGEGLGSYDISVNRGALNDGTHSATLTATSSANTVEVTILVSKGIAFESDGGFQYILLIDPDTQVVLARFTRRASKGTYPFEFPSVPPGEYHLVTGSDQDADGFICDGGESCGGFPLLSQLERIVLQDDMVDLEINLSFQAPLQSAIATPGAEQTAPALPGPFPTTSP